MWGEVRGGCGGSVGVWGEVRGGCGGSVGVWGEVRGVCGESVGCGGGNWEVGGMNGFSDSHIASIIYFRYS